LTGYYFLSILFVASNNLYKLLKLFIISINVWNYTKIIFETLPPRTLSLKGTCPHNNSVTINLITLLNEHKTINFLAFIFLVQNSFLNKGF